MTTVTAQVLPAVGAIRLTITAPSGVVVSKVQRSDINGPTAMRVLAGQLPYTSTGAELVLDDYEAASGAVVYTITASDGAVTVPLTHPLAGAPWLGVPVLPQLSVSVESTADYGADVEARGVLFDVADSPYPITINREATARRGSLKVYAHTYADARGVLRLVQRGQVIFLRQTEHDGMDMYFSPRRASLGIELADGPDSRFSVSIEYAEVARPLSPLSGALGWTYAALKADQPTYSALPGTFADYTDLRTNFRTTP